MPKLEPVAQCAHVRVRIFQQFVRMWDDTHSPGIDVCILASLEAQVEVTRVLGIDTEGVDRTFGIGFRVSCQPAFCIEC